MDIVTSNSVLAKRDAEENQELFHELGLTCSHNMDDTRGYESGEKLCYKADIVYGDGDQFQFDWLRHHYAGLSTMCDRDEIG